MPIKVLFWCKNLKKMLTENFKLFLLLKFLYILQYNTSLNIYTLLLKFTLLIFSHLSIKCSFLAFTIWNHNWIFFRYQLCGFAFNRRNLTILCNQLGCILLFGDAVDTKTLSGVFVLINALRWKGMKWQKLLFQFCFYCIKCGQSWF